MAASRVTLWLVAALAGCLISSADSAPKDVCAANPFGGRSELSASLDGKPLRLAIAGLVHGHVDGFLRAVQSRSDVDLIGIFESDPAVQRKYAQQFGLADTILFSTLEAMLDAVKPEAVASFTSTSDHVKVVEACAPRHVPVMMEKPLATSIEQARRIQRAADRGGISVMVNYETTWYRSHAALWNLIRKERAAGDIRKMVALDGHQGPKEIGVQPEFLDWLTDPVRNGAGALYDFGCYGANLMTWMMDDQRPLTVTARTSHFKPLIYPRVDDDATVVLQYAAAQGIIQASWNWPFSRKDFEVYCEQGYALAIGGSTLRVRLPDQAEEETRTPEVLPAGEQDSISYLTSILRNKRKPSGLSSLANNLVVTEILEAARESARSGKTISLAR